MGHLLAARTLRFRDAQDRTRGEAVRHAAIMEDWARAVIYHPLAYIQHRPTFMWNFLAGQNLTMWIADVEHPTAIVFPDRPAFAALISLHDLLKPTPLFRVGCSFASPRADSPGGDARDARRRLRPRRLRVGRRLCPQLFLPSASRRIFVAVLAGIAGGVVAALGRCKASTAVNCALIGRQLVVQSRSCTRPPRCPAVFSGTRRSTRSRHP
jgi:hypothetical protein